MGYAIAALVLGILGFVAWNSMRERSTGKQLAIVDGVVDAQEQERTAREDIEDEAQAELDAMDANR